MLLPAIPFVVLWISGPPGHDPAQISAQPLHFIENCGQWEASVGFAARCRDGAARIERDGIVFSARSGANVSLRFEGAREDVLLDPRDTTCTRYSFFLGRDPERWRGGAPAHRLVRGVGVYEGVDIEYREGAERGVLEYDLRLDDPTSLDRVVVRCEGTTGLEVDPDGALRIRTGHGDLRQSPPRTWQLGAGGEERPVECRYRIIDGERFGFEASRFDPSLPLTIDPALGMFSFVGTGGADRVVAIARRPDSDVYAVGMTEDASAFAVHPGNCVALEGDPSGGRNALVARLSPLGELLAVAVLGGVSDDEAVALQVDKELGVSVCGYTSSDDFPATNGSTYQGGDGFLIPGDAFVARLSADLCRVSFSTFLGGSKRDGSQALGVNAEGQIVVLGFTASPDFPATPGAYQETYQGGAYDTTLSVLDPTRGPALEDQLLYSTFFGGSGSDSWDGIRNPENDLSVFLVTGGLAIDAQGQVAIGGMTRSPDFPTTEGAFQTAVKGGLDAWAAILVTDPERAPEEQLVWSTLIGGYNFDASYGVAFGPEGGVWIAGQTFYDIPTTPDAHQPFAPGSSEGFLAHFDPALQGKDQLTYSTFIGGGGWEWANEVSVGPSGMVAVVGAGDFPGAVKPNQGALQETFAGSWDGYLVVLDPELAAGDQLLYSTFIGGMSAEDAWGVHFDGATAWVAGETFSSEFSPFPGVPSAGGRDGYVLAIDLRLPRAVFTATGPDASGRFTFDASPSKAFEGTTLVSYAWDFGDGATAEGAQAEHLYGAAGRYVVTLSVTSDGGLVVKAGKTVEVHCPSNPLDPWTALDIGAPGFAGTARSEGTGVSLCAGGKRLVGNADSLHFVYQQVDCEDFTFTARIDSAAAGNDSAEVGLMVREELEPRARQVSLVLEKLATAGASLARLVSRSKPSAGATPAAARSPLVPPAAWLRIERQGDVLQASVSVDGSTWIDDAFKPVSLADFGRTVYVGFAGMGEEPTDAMASFRPVQATFAAIRIDCAAGIAFRRGEANGDGQTDLSDVIGLLGYLFLGGTAPDCLEAGDIDDSGELNITDPIALLGHLFQGGAAPPEPFVVCGGDPTRDDLGCAGGSCQ